MPNQAAAYDLPFYGIFVPHKVSSLSKISDGVIANNLWFAPLPIKKPCYAYGGGKLRVGTPKSRNWRKRLRTPGLEDRKLVIRGSKLIHVGANDP